MQSLSRVLPSRLAAVAPAQWSALARQTRFCRRQPRKIDPVAFLLGVCLWAGQAQPTLRRAASFIGLCAGTTVSKQNIAQRCGLPAAQFVRAAVAALLARLARGRTPLPPGALESFGRVLIQDSTAVKLPAQWAARFPGNANWQGQFALLKIQCIYELLTEQFVQWELSSFRVNDQRAAGQILAVVQPRDLVLRDLGYFTLESFRQLQLRGAFFLSRLWQGVSVWQTDGHPLDLLGRLQHAGWLDEPVLLGLDQPLAVRLVAVPVSAAVANQRRRQARQDRDQRHPPSAKRLALLGWDIFITNVPAPVWSARTLRAVYGLRWRIEIVFKSAKSHLQLSVIPQTSAVEVELLIWARLLLLTLLQGWLATGAPSDRDPPLSLLKAAEWLGLFCPLLLLAPLATTLPQRLLCQIRYHCRYEKRKRINYAQTFSLLEPILKPAKIRCILREINDSSGIWDRL